MFCRHGSVRGCLPWPTVHNGSTGCNRQLQDTDILLELGRIRSGSLCCELETTYLHLGSTRSQRDDINRAAPGLPPSGSIRMGRLRVQPAGGFRCRDYNLPVTWSHGDYGLCTPV